MTDAGGTTTLIQLGNEGPYMKYLIRNTSVDNGQTIPFDGPSNSPVVAEDKVIILGGTNFTQETAIGGGTTTVEYDETAKHFTVTDASASSSDVAIVFIYIPKGDSALADPS